MSSTIKTTVIVHNGDYNEESRKIPILAFFEKAHRQFDAGDYSGYEDMYTEDFSFRSMHGEHLDHETGYHDDHTFTREAQRFFKDPLAEHEQLVDKIFVVGPNDGHYDIVWIGTFYANVKGNPGANETKAKSHDGKEWDVALPVTWVFDLVDDSSAPHGFKIAHGRVFKDTSKIYELLDQRDHGHLKPTAK